MIEAPFTPGQVNCLNAYQASGKMHPFTCDCINKCVMGAKEDGWHCQIDDTLRQTWAHAFMTTYGSEVTLTSTLARTPQLEMESQMKMLQLINKCNDCPNKKYYSGGQYECSAAGGVAISAETLTNGSIASFCPLPNYPAQRIVDLEAEVARLHNELKAASLLTGPTYRG